MSFYESVFILRQDLTTDNAKSLCEKFSKVLEDSGGKIAKTEYWGLRNLSFKIKKNKKGHYFLINSESSAPAVSKMKQLLNIDENILRYLTIRINEVEKGPSIIMEEEKDNGRTKVKEKMGANTNKKEERKQEKNITKNTPIK